MNIHRRRVVAFIASHLIISDRVTSIYDLQTEQETMLTGEISPSLISVYDHDRKDYVLGHKKSCETVSLTDLSSQYGIDLLLDKPRFHGVDHETGKSFRGELADRIITFHDEADQVTYQYRI
jgi:hypothetical protein